MKELLVVACGSFCGGGLRYGVSRLLGLLSVGPFPLATFMVNILGCLLIGLVSACPAGQWLTPQSKLFLTTGLCGGFTTFSTFMNENAALLEADDSLMLSLYIIGSLALGMGAVLLGHWLGNLLVS